MATHSSILAQRIPMDRGAWRATVQEVAKSQTRLRVTKHAHTHGNHFAIHLKLTQHCKSTILQ